MKNLNHEQPKLNCKAWKVQNVNSIYQDPEKLKSENLPKTKI